MESQMLHRTSNNDDMSCSPDPVAARIFGETHGDVQATINRLVREWGEASEEIRRCLAAAGASRETRSGSESHG